MHDLLAEARSSLRRIDPFRVHAAMQAGALLIDIRSNEERAEHGSIPGSLQIPLSVLEWRGDPDSGHHDPAIGIFGASIILICAWLFIQYRGAQAPGTRICQRDRRDRWLQGLRMPG